MRHFSLSQIYFFYINAFPHWYCLRSSEKSIACVIKTPFGLKIRNKGTYQFLFSIFLIATLVEYIIHSNATHISYVSVDGRESTAIVAAVNSKLGFDGVKYRLWYIDQSDTKIYNSKLDGSDLKSFSASNMGFFAVNGINETVYYVHSVNSKINSVTYAGTALPEISDLQATDFEDIQVDPYNQ